MRRSPESLGVIFAATGVILAAIILEFMLSNAVSKLLTEFPVTVAVGVGTCILTAFWCARLLRHLLISDSVASSLAAGVTVALVSVETAMIAGLAAQAVGIAMQVDLFPISRHDLQDIFMAVNLFGGLPLVALGLLYGLICRFGLRA